MCPYICTIVLSFVTPLLCTVPSAPSVSEALRRWEAIRDPGSLEALSECASVVREGLEKGDQSILPRLLDITKNGAVALRARTQALTIACESADAEGAAKIVETMAVQREEMFAARRAEPNREWTAKARDTQVLLAGFAAESARHLLERIPDHTGILLLAAEDYKYALPSPRTGIPAARLMADCVVPQDVMDAKLLEILQSG